MKKIISARSLVFKLNNSRWFSFSLSFIFAFLAYNTLALGANCEFVAQEKIDQKALALLKNSSSTYPTEARSK